MAGNWHAGRAAEFAAMKFLRANGYETERISGSDRRFDIIAWNGERTRCIVIRTSRTGKASAFPDLLKRLTQLAEIRGIPGEIEFWISRQAGWIRYEVLPGGVMPDRREE